MPRTFGSHLLPKIYVIAFAALLAMQFSDAFGQRPGPRPPTPHPDLKYHGDKLAEKPEHRPYLVVETPSEKKYGVNNWKIIGSEKLRDEFISTLDKALPGRDIEVATLLNRIYFQRDLMEINKAWEEVANHKPDELPSNESAVEAYFRGKKGKTLLVIGHVVGTDFVLTDSTGNAEARIAISSIEKLAARNNVHIIPIGCKTAAAGVRVGFTQNIITKDVAKLLGAIGSRPTYGALIAAMIAVGEVTISLNEKASTVSVGESDGDVLSDIARLPKEASGIYIRFSIPRMSNPGNDAPTFPSIYWIAIVPTVLFLSGLLGGFGLKKLSASRFILDDRARANLLPLIVDMHVVAKLCRYLGQGLLIILVALLLLVISPWILLIILLVLPYLFDSDKNN